MKELVISAAAVLAYVVWRQTLAPSAQEPAPESPIAELGRMDFLPESPEWAGSAAWDGVWRTLNPWTAIQSTVNNYQTRSAVDEANVQAFLKMIRHAEGTERAGLDPYAVCYGYSFTIRDFSDHPTILGHWKGKVLPDAMCRGAGFGPGCVSTAAGAYQFISSTWQNCKRALSLPDFGPESQDRAAVYLIKQRGALDDVKAGRVAEAIEKCRREWASMPGAGYGQPERRRDDLIAVYESAGGMLA